MEEYTIENLKNEINLIKVILKYNVKPLIHVLGIEKIYDKISKDDIDKMVFQLHCFYEIISRSKKEYVEILLFDLRRLVQNYLVEFAHIWLCIKELVKTDSSIVENKDIIDYNNKEIEKTLSKFKSMISNEFMEELEKILKKEE